MHKGLSYNGSSSQNLDNGIEDEPEKRLMNDKLTMVEFINEWLELFKKNTIKPSTYRRLLGARDALQKYSLATKKVGEISYFDLQRYINDLAEAGYSLNGIKKQILIVTAPLRLAAAMRIIPADPCVGIKLPSESKLKKKTKEVIAYTDDEQERLQKTIAKEPDNPGYLAVAFLLETGLRSGELLALKWTDVQIDASRMRIHATILNPQYTGEASYQDSAKSRTSNRTIPLTPKAIAILKRLREHRQTEWVFEQDGHRYSYQQLTYQTRKLCREAKVDFHGAHAFRHTFATNCYYKGIDIKILSRLMGHSSVQVTYNIYINLYGDGFDDMYAALCF